MGQSGKRTQTPKVRGEAGKSSIFMRNKKKTGPHEGTEGTLENNFTQQICLS